MSETTQRDELARVLDEWLDDEAPLNLRRYVPVADALLPFIERAKAEALREAADASDDEATHLERAAQPGCIAFTQRDRAIWLRQRADAIEKGTEG